jgi:hypothetical protein
MFTKVYVIWTELHPGRPQASFLKNLRLRWFHFHNVKELGFEFRAWWVLGRCSTTWATPSAICEYSMHLVNSWRCRFLHWLTLVADEQDIYTNGNNLQTWLSLWVCYLPLYSGPTPVHLLCFLHKLDIWSNFSICNVTSYFSLN